MRYTLEDFKIKPTSRDICGTYGMIFYKDRALVYKHKCHRLDCPECRTEYFITWETRMLKVFKTEYLFMTRIKPSQYSSFRRKYKIPYVRIKFGEYYTIVTSTELPNFIPITLEELMKFIKTQQIYIKNFITGNGLFRQELSCHFLQYNNNNNSNMQKMAKNDFLGRAVKPFGDKNPSDIKQVWEQVSNKEKANILRKLEETKTLKLTEEGIEFVRTFADKTKFELAYRDVNLKLDPRAIVVFETTDFIGYIIPERE